MPCKVRQVVDNCINRERFFALDRMIAKKANDLEGDVDVRGEKKVYCLSLESLVNPLLDNYLLSFVIRNVVAEAIEEAGQALVPSCTTIVSSRGARPTSPQLIVIHGSPEIIQYFLADQYESHGKHREFVKALNAFL